MNLHRVPTRAAPITLGDCIGFIAENQFNYDDPEAAMLARRMLAMLWPIPHRTLPPSDLPDFDIPVYPVSE